MEAWKQSEAGKISKGHDWNSEFSVDKAATCITEGSKSIHCKNCDAVKDSTAIAAKGHTYGMTGAEIYICTVCGYEDESRKPAEEDKPDTDKPLDDKSDTDNPSEDSKPDIDKPSGDSKPDTDKPSGDSKPDSDKPSEIPSDGDDSADKPVAEDKFDISAEVSEGAPVRGAILGTLKAELLAATGIFTVDEKKAIESGAEVKVYISVKKLDADSIPTEDRTKIETAAKDTLGIDMSIEFMDLSLMKKVGTDVDKAVHEPGMSIDVSVKLPDSMINKTPGVVRIYRIIRLHEGVVDVINGTFDSKTSEFNFQTDKFSTYAIAYSDVKKDIVIKSQDDKTTLSLIGETLQLSAAPTETPKDESQKADATQSPKTGDETTAVFWMFVAMLGFTTIVVGNKRRNAS